jgi:hypothetical protein
MSPQIQLCCGPRTTRRTRQVEQVHAVHSQRCGADPRIDPLNGVVSTAG